MYFLLVILRRKFLLFDSIEESIDYLSSYSSTNVQPNACERSFSFLFQTASDIIALSRYTYLSGPVREVFLFYFRLQVT